MNKHNSFLLSCFYLTISVFSFNGCDDKLNIEDHNRNIVFLSNRDDQNRHQDIFIVNIDSLNVRKLTESKQNVISTSNPTISRSGKLVAYMHLENKQKNLAIIDLDSSKTVLKCTLNNSAPSFEFTNDNTKLIFTDLINQKRQIFCLDLISDEILNLSDTNYNEFEPSVSRNGQFITYTREEKKGSSIWVMNIDGSNRREVFYENVSNRFPNFSPDNETIAFSSSYRASRQEDSDIFIIKKDGSNLENVFNDIYYLTRPMFSPNGESLIFLSNRRGRKYQDIFIINFETGEKYNITRLMDFINKDYSFTQEGNSIIFENIVYNNSDIFLFDLTTKTFKEIVNHPSWDSSPSI